MTHRVMIEFVVEVPDENVAKDVLTRLAREHHARLCEVLQSVTGYPPIQMPGRHGIFVAIEPVTWLEKERDWVGPDEDE